MNSSPHNSREAGAIAPGDLSDAIRPSTDGDPQPGGGVFGMLKISAELRDPGVPYRMLTKW